jgi:WD40 repeat protein
VQCAIFADEGKTLITTGHDGKVHLWDVAETLRHGQ